MSMLTRSQKKSVKSSETGEKGGLFGYTPKRAYKQRKISRIRRQYGYKSLLYSLIVTTLIVLGILFVFFFKNTSHNAPSPLNTIMKKMGFTAHEIHIDGRKNTNSNLLKRKMLIEKGQPIFATSPDEIRESLEEIDWIKNATVMRQLPHQIFIKIKERTPIAIWYFQKKTYLIDREGASISPKKINKFKGLPVVVGEEAPLHAAKILALLLKFPHIKKNIVSLIRVRKRRWDLILYKKVVVKLPEDHESENTLESALARLSLLMDQKKIHLEDMKYIDMRLKNRIILKAKNNLAKAKIKSANKGRDT